MKPHFTVTPEDLADELSLTKMATTDNRVSTFISIMREKKDAYLSSLFENSLINNSIGAFTQLFKKFISVVGWFSLGVNVT